MENIKDKVICSLNNWNDKNEIEKNYDQWNPIIKLDSGDIRLINYIKNYDVNNFNTEEYLKSDSFSQESLFINFEGIDNSGKSTCVNYLKNKENSYFYTKEPDDSKWIGKQVRNSINSDKIDPIIVFYLFFADHIVHLENVIKPNLKKGYNILCDRYIFSRYAYQSYTLNNRMQNPLLFLRQLHETGNWTVFPDITIYLDVNVKNSLKRMNSKPEKYENKEYLKSIRSNYSEISDIYNSIFKKINTNNKNKDEVLEEVLNILY